MAGIIDIRKNTKTGRWIARPRFSYDAESFKNGPAKAEGSTPAMAVLALADLLPEDKANRLRLNCPERIYRSPEYVWMNDKCIDVDGHCPRKDEWAKRRADFLFDCKLGHEDKYGVIE